MSTKLERMIQKKRLEIQELEQKVRDERTYLRALEDAMRAIPKGGDGVPESDETESSLKAGSQLATVRDLILAAGKPLHVDELLRQMNREVNKQTRTSLAGSLGGYARKSRVFKHEGPNIFGLMEMETAKNEEEAKEEKPSQDGSTVAKRYKLV